jgi:pantetheine-phosphate adenylyltransferase
LTIAIYPGTFDPITNGHLDVVTRASKIFDKIIMGVFEKSDKNLFFTAEERVALAKKAVAHLSSVEVVPFRELTVDFAKRVGAKVMIRGLRMNADFEKEFEMAMMNRKLCKELDMVCLMASQEYQFLSSSILKEVACLNGNIDCLVPKHVATALKKRCRARA